jgi:hypothetical protein
MASQNQVIAVVIKQYGTGLYRTCVSLNKESITFLSTHKDERSANETIGLFWRAYDEGRLKTPDDMTSFVHSIQPISAPETDHRPVSQLVPGTVEQVFLPLAV